MIIEGNQRGYASQLAKHLMNIEDNDHIVVHEVSGFYSENVEEALREMHITSRATKCTQFMFSVSLNPPQNEKVPIEHFEEAIEEIEQKMGLDDQPRVIVFHEKEGRRHAHCVWSRINADTMTAINLPFYKRKLNEISKEQYLKHDWNMPRGFIDRKYANPLNFTREQWQQAKRTKDDPRMIKQIFKQAWEQSDNKQSFEKALQEYGFALARGDKRGFVAVDYKGEVYSLSKWAGVKTKELKQRLGSPKNLLSVQEVKEDHAQKMTKRLKEYINEVRQERSKKFEPLKGASLIIRERHRAARERLEIKQAERHIVEEKQRTSRLPKGLFGLLSRLTGKHQRVEKQNRIEAQQCHERDKQEKHELMDQQLQERGRLQEQIHKFREEHNEITLQLRQDIGRYMEMKDKDNLETFKFTLEHHLKLIVTNLV